MRSLVGSVLVLVLVFMILGGCTQNVSDSERSRFVGSWKSVYSPSVYNSTYVINHTFTFFGNGSASGYFAHSWELKDGKLIITFVSDNLTASSTYRYVFSNENTKLTLTDVKMGRPTNYTKIT